MSFWTKYRLLTQCSFILRDRRARKFLDFQCSRSYVISSDKFSVSEAFGKNLKNFSRVNVFSFKIGFWKLKQAMRCFDKGLWPKTKVKDYKKESRNISKTSRKKRKSFSSHIEFYKWSLAQREKRWHLKATATKKS